MTIELDLGLDAAAATLPAPKARSATRPKASAAPGSPTLRSQWRLSSVELVNWGTFDGHHRVEIGRRGHLITGHSGSGKSSLLDAIATVLTPRKWLRFNAAAQDVSARAGDDRSLVSYVRGAWRRQTDEESGSAVAEYLRTGATWSGILLRYATADGATPVNLIRLFHLKRGANTNNDLTEVHVLQRGDVGLLDFAEHARNGIEVRHIKAAWPDAVVTKEHSVFSARFTRLLGIGSDSALQLLHKTQSAKNLGSLDQLFRNFMLDEPKTFAMAQTAVAQFEELAEAHRVVVEARQQVELLRRMREPSLAYEQGRRDSAEAERLSLALDAFTALRSLQCARDELEQLAERRAAAEQELALAEARAATAREELLVAQGRVREVGGDALESERLRLQSAEERLASIGGERRRWRRKLEEVGVAFPASASDYEQLRQTARRERAELATAQHRSEADLAALNDRRTEAEQRLAGILAELAELRNRRSNLPPALLIARKQVAEQTGLPETVFPFVGELIDVLPDWAGWTGAIERVLRPLATVMLVQSEHLLDVSAVVDRLHLGARLVYESVPPTVEPPLRTRSERSLIHRVRVADGPMSGWVHRRLSERFDYECVDEVRDLHSTEHGVTRAGQVKRSSRVFEKDDRSHVEDRRQWILGSSNDAKLDLLRDAHRDTTASIMEIKAHIQRFEAQRRAADLRTSVLAELDDLEWTALDTEAAQAALDGRREAYARLREGNAQLVEAQRIEEDARTRDETAESLRRQKRAEADAFGAKASELEARIAAFEGSAEDASLPDDVLNALDARFRAITRSQSLANLEETARKVTAGLAAERREADAVEHRALQQFETLAADFCRQWAALSSELTPRIADRAGFSELHDRIVSTGLPEYEGRFFTLLKEQSRQLTGQLLSEIRNSGSQIRSRIDPVNTSLLRSPFDAGRFLQIVVKDQRSDEVTDFMRQLRTISEGSWGEEDNAAAERRFGVLREVMEKLGSTEHAGWKRRCLDTREHVTFVGIEQDEHGTEMNRHDSGAGLSGGQRQKLVIFCLAAALRYQLAEDEDDVPGFGTIVLDEAFDKADTDFTRMAMDVFLEFGFHMILATPLKLLQTLEAYVDGISSVSCRDHRDSRVSAVLFESVEPDDVHGSPLVGNAAGNTE